MTLTEAFKPSFVVDNTLVSVPVTIPALPYLTEAGTAFQAFPAADNILILEYGIKLPGCFDWTLLTGGAEPRFQAGWAKASDGSNLTFWTSEFLVPVPNVPIKLDGSQQDGYFRPHYSLAYPDPGVAGKLHWLLNDMDISMVNVPSALNGTTQYICPWVKIQHQKALV